MRMLVCNPIICKLRIKWMKWEEIEGLSMASWIELVWREWGAGHGKLCISLDNYHVNFGQLHIYKDSSYANHAHWEFSPIWKDGVDGKTVFIVPC